MNYIIIALVIIVFIVTGVFGTHYGYTVNGIPQNEKLTLSNILDYLWNFCTFGIDGIPALLSLIYDVLIVLFAVCMFLSFGWAGLIIAGVLSLGGLIGHLIGG